MNSSAFIGAYAGVILANSSDGVSPYHFAIFTASLIGSMVIGYVIGSFAWFIAFRNDRDFCKSDAFVIGGFSGVAFGLFLLVITITLKITGVF